MSELKNISAVVWGDMSADSAADNYPTKTLCPDCLGDYEVVTEEDKHVYFPFCNHGSYLLVSAERATVIASYRESCLIRNHTCCRTCAT